MNMYKFAKTDVLRQQAQGRWLEIFQALCPGMFDDAIHNLGTHVTCPFHGGEEDFRFLKRGTKKGGSTREVGAAMCTCGSYTDGFSVLQRATGARFPDVLKMLDEYLNGVAVRAPVLIQAPVRTPEEDKDRDAKVLAKVNNLWQAGKPLNLAETSYYLERGISKRVLADLQDVRQMASLGYYTMQKGELVKLGSYPALLALMRNAKGEPVAVHRTWLSKDRCEKAPVPKAKKLSETPDARGAAIRLFDATGSDTLGLSEGIETGVSVRQLAMGRYWPELGLVPVWACYAERNIRSFVIPPELLPTLKRIIVFADNDENGKGLEAATEFKERMAVEHPDIEVVIKLPPVVGWDWNDVLLNL